MGMIWVCASDTLNSRRLTISACLLLPNAHAVAYSLLTLRVFRARSLSPRVPFLLLRYCLLTVVASSGSVRDHLARTEPGIERRSATRAAVVAAEAFCERRSSVRYLLLVLVVLIPTRATEHLARRCCGTPAKARDAPAEDLRAALA
jgi:hypothetical protein